jgi:hypothetical protein
MKFITVSMSTAFGRILGSGPAAIGEHFNNPRVPVVKRQSVAAYDPRATKDDDGLPRFSYEEPLPPHNIVFSITEEEIDSTFDF